jgi:hypothetical protein
VRSAPLKMLLHTVSIASAFTDNIAAVVFALSLLIGFIGGYFWCGFFSLTTGGQVVNTLPDFFQNKPMKKDNSLKLLL